jgi:hypothetical protein
MKKLRTLNPKRLAAEFDDSSPEPPTMQLLQAVTPATNKMMEENPTSISDEKLQYKSLENNLTSQNDRLL